MDIGIGIGEEIGWRESMEDAHAVYHIPEKEFFSAEIFDGHGGKEAAQISAEIVTPHFIHTWSQESNKPLIECRTPVEILRDTYLATDSYIVSRGIKSGTTVAGLYIIKNMFIVANAGDTRVIMGTSSGTAQLTVDHKPDLPEEKKRIESLGGEVIVYGVPRVQGILAISRALGDVSLKPFVSPEPRIVEGYLGKENDYAVLACDGVWDVLTPEAVMDIIRKRGEPRQGADDIIARALFEGSTDNITVIVLDMRIYTKRLKRKRMKLIRFIDRT
ncbi:MAG TPA: hypothetical protein DDW17_07755 [Deltaproteobacteria bacterium]|nr:hypothetical protein [Deltaproteobacteria bacterium]